MIVYSIYFFLFCMYFVCLFVRSLKQMLCGALKYQDFFVFFAAEARDDPRDFSGVHNRQLNRSKMFEYSQLTFFKL